jgi:hypothetical protein
MCFDCIKKIPPDKLKQNIYFLAVLDLPVGGTINSRARHKVVGF